MYPVVAAAEATVSAPLLANVPRRAILVVHCPNLQRLTRTWESLGPLRGLDDRWIGGTLKRLERIDDGFSRTWTQRLGLNAADLYAVLPGEVVIGWMPRASKTDAAFHADEWVLIARSSPDSETAARRLWQDMKNRLAPRGRSTRRSAGGVSIEQIVWETTRKAQFSNRRPPRIPGRHREEPPSRIPRNGFGETVTVERHAMSLGFGNGLLYFSPSRAERLDPWIANRPGSYRTTRPTERLHTLIGQARGEGEAVLAIQAIPPAWVPPVESPREIRLGGNPLYVLLSQTRSLELVVARRDDRLSLDVRSTVLPPPGWLARLLATFGESASFSAAEDNTAEVVVNADIPRLWSTLGEVLAEGWPAVRVALDTFLAPLAGASGEGAAALAESLGTNARLLVFGPGAEDAGKASWALTVDLRDPQRFALLQPRLAQLLRTFACDLVDYEVTAEGALRERARATTGGVALRAGQLHGAHSPTHFTIAGSRTALAKAIRTAHRPSNRPPDSAGQAARVDTRRRSLSSLSAIQQGRGPAIGLFYEAIPGLTFGGPARRLIRGPAGTIELISPPPDEPKATPAPSKTERKRPATVRPQPAARLVGALVVESEKEVRLQLGLEILTDAGTAARPPKPRVLREPVIQE